MIKTLIFLFIGGGLGAIVRYLISKLSLAFYSGSFPVATLLANLIACIVLGVIVYLYSLKPEQGNKVLYFFLITGFCGGLSTFSTFSFETLELLKQQQYIYAVVNVLLSVCVSIGVLYFIYNKSIQ